MRLITISFALATMLSTNALAQEDTFAYRWEQDSKLLACPLNGPVCSEKVPRGKEKELLVAKRTTLKKPPSFTKGKWPKWNEETSDWEIVDLYVDRTIYDKVTKQSREVEYAKDGNAIPEGWTSVAPPENCEFCEWNEESASWPENTAKKSAAAEEIARKKAISDDATRKALRDKLQSASLSQIRSYVKGLFPGLSAEQQEFLVGLLLLLAN